jgi:hypothetical protein
MVGRFAGTCSQLTAHSYFLCSHGHTVAQFFDSVIFPPIHNLFSHGNKVPGVSGGLFVYNSFVS